MDRDERTINKVITIDTTQASQDLERLGAVVEKNAEETDALGKSYNDLSKELKSLKDAYKDSTDEVEKANLANKIAEINSEIKEMNKAMSASANSTGDAVGSYNALTKEMSELKKAFKATNDESERMELAKKISGINDQLKDMDASIGNYQRNVGNYAAAFTQGLEGITTKFVAMNSPMKLVKQGVAGVEKAFKALIANPIGAVITALVVTFQTLKKAFASNEEASNKLKKAFSVLEPITNAIKNALGFVVNKVGDLALAFSALANSAQSAGVKIMELLNKIGLVSDEKLQQLKDNIDANKTALQVSQELAEREIAMVERRRKYALLEAKTNEEVSELKAKAAETEKYTAQERQKFYEEAQKKEKALFEEKLAMAQEEFDIEKARAAQAVNSTEDNERLVQAEVKLYNVKEEYNNKMRELNKKLATTNKEVAKSTDDLSESLEVLAAQYTGLNLGGGIQSDGIIREVEIIENEPEPEEDIREIMDRSIRIKEAKLQIAQEYSVEYFNILREIEEEEWRMQQATVEYSKKSNEEKEALEAAHAANMKKLFDQQAQMTLQSTKSYTSALGNLFGALSENTSQGSEQWKRYQIMSAQMSMLSGVVEAISGAMQLGPIAGPVMGAINSAAVIASGTANINKIKATTLANAGNSADTSAGFVNSISSYTPTYTRQVTTESDSKDLQAVIQDSANTIKCYVVESDIEEVRNRVEVREQEVTF